MSLGDGFILSSRPLRLNFVSSFPPRECGIATFTYDLTSSISHIADNITWNINVVQECKNLFLSNASLRDQAMRLSRKEIALSKRFRSKTFNVIKDCDLESYVAAADKINESKIDVVNIQHEFGLFRGDFGSYILEFMRQVRKPIVTTLHTILPHPPRGMKDIVKDIYALSDVIVTSADSGIKLLSDVYSLNKKKITLVPHGVPSVPFIETAKPKQRLGLTGKFVIASFGLINPDKGIDTVIEALPSIIEENPNKELIYMVVGKHHPALDKKVRQQYKERLDGLITRLGLVDKVVFVDRYLSNKEMIAHFLATDVCAVTNTNPNQISSGVLSQAIGCGKPIIATEFTHAKEVLSHGRGMLVKIGSPEDVAEKINRLVNDEELRKAISRNVYGYAQSITWDRIARRYVDIFSQLKVQIHPTASTSTSTLAQTSSL